MLSSFLLSIMIMSCLCSHGRAFMFRSGSFLSKNLAKRSMSGLLATSAGVPNQHLLSVAPMMEYTDRHQRYLQRLLSKQTVLYTEMVTTMAIVCSGDTERFLRADIETEQPLVLQLGGSDPAQMKQAAQSAWSYGYKEINLNIGCPSPKVSGAGCFGAVLYLNPPLVSQLALSVSEVTGTPTTVKCRIGVDNHESYEELCNFIRTVSEVGKVEHFIIHARIAVLGKKFTPKDNRSIPPLKYDVVHRLIHDFPHLKFSLNGGVASLDQVQSLLAEHSQLYGVMVGRAVVNDPFAWGKADSLLYKQTDPGLSRYEVIQQYAAYCAKQQALHGDHFARTLVKPLHNLWHGQPHGKAWRQNLEKGCLAKLSAYDILMQGSEMMLSMQEDSARRMLELEAEAEKQKLAM